MVQAVRDTEKAMGKVDYTVNQANRGGGRSLYVAKDIKAGEQFTPENVRSVRPSCGLHPKYFEEILGKTAARDLPFGTALKKEDIDFRRKAMKFLVYFDGLNQLDRRGISLWNVSVCLVDIFLNTLKTTDFEIKLIIPQTAFFQYQYYKKLSVADRKKFSSLDGERLIPFYEAMKDNIIPIGDDELRNCFPDHMSLDEIYGATLEKRITPEQTANLKKVILGKLGNWRPDMVVAYPLTLNWLHDIFENTPVLVNEWAIFSRAPLPRSIYFDPCGSLDFSFLNKFKQEIQNYQLTEEQNRQVEAFKRKFVSLMNERMNVLFLMNPYLKKFEKLILVPLVGSYRVKDMSGFPDDATIIQEVMEKVPQNVGVIFTGHNQDKMSYGYVIAYQQKYPNFIYIPQLSSFGMQSPPVFPYVDAIVNHLSATGIMAMLWDIPVIPLDGHYNDWIKDADSLDDLEKVLSAPKRNKNNMIYWYMTHYAIFENRFNDAGFYKSFFINKLKKFKEKGITFDFYEKINDFQEVAEYTISVLKSAFSPYIQSKKTYRLFGIEIFKIKKVSGEKKYYIMGLPVAKLKKLPRGKKHLSILHIPVFTMKEK